jgi:hypothetical protein
MVLGMGRLPIRQAYHRRTRLRHSMSHPSVLNFSEGV